MDARKLKSCAVFVWDILMQQEEKIENIQKRGNGLKLGKTLLSKGLIEQQQFWIILSKYQCWCCSPLFQTAGWFHSAWSEGKGPQP